MVENLVLLFVGIAIAVCIPILHERYSKEKESGKEESVFLG